ncbi:hypothetical protein LB579_32270, partial [Mesorhizobium sp. BR1-1-7]|uniref:hypothetical protein n=1 Tax=Mesorhizobium sp. BR1-1-7 TaxID=2876647 RepID=UPI001CCF8A2F
MLFARGGLFAGGHREEAIKENQDAALSPCSGLRRSSRSLGLPDGVLPGDVLAGVLAVLLEVLDV